MDATEDRLRKIFLILLLVLVSAIFFLMIRGFLMTLLLAAIASGLVFPLYRRIRSLCRGRKGLASLLTLLLLAVCVIGPLLAFLAVVARQAYMISEAGRPWVEQFLAEPRVLTGYLEHIPFLDQLEPYREQILNKLGQIAESLGAFVFQSLSSITRGSFTFLFHCFLMAYSMFFFLKDEGGVLRRILYYLPLPHEDEVRIVERFVSVTRATLKGTVIIGAIQGILAGTALGLAGIQGPVFWGTMMMVLSIIPGVGTGLVWGPAVIYLLVTGRVLAGVLLAAWCLAVVGSVDNFLRPRLVGKDTRMHDLFILFGTLGGIVLFGIAGFIIGPIVATLFVTIWEMYGVVFRDSLPRVGPLGDPEN